MAFGCTFVLFHTVLLCAYAFDLRSISRRFPAPVKFWAVMSGGDNIYSLFVPDVASPSGLRCIVDFEDRQRVIHFSERTVNNEVSQRFTSIHYNVLNAPPENQVWLAENVASYVFTHYPNAQQVHVVAAEQLSPSLSAAQEGARPVWTNYSIGAFQLPQ